MAGHLVIRPRGTQAGPGCQVGMEKGVSENILEGAWVSMHLLPLGAGQ